MRRIRTRNQAEWHLARLALCKELVDRRKIWIFTFAFWQVLKRKYLRWIKMLFPRLNHTIPSRLEVMRDTLYMVIGVSVIRVGSTFDGIQSCIDIVTGGRTHWCGLKAIAKFHSLRCEPINIRRKSLPTVAANIAKCTIISDDKDDIRTFQIVFR